MSTPANPMIIQATERDDTLNPRQLRKAGFIPTTIYSKDTESKSIQVKTKEFVTHYGRGLRIFELDGVKATVRAKQVQIDPLTQAVLSVEFLEINPEDAKKAMAAEAQRRADEAAALEEAKAQAKANAKAAAAAAAAEAEAAEKTDEGGDAAPKAEAEAEKAPATA